MDLLVNVSVGELLDKISILEIKSERINDAKKLENVMKELDILSKIATENLAGCKDWIKKIKEINEKLWVIEDDIRQKERDKAFDNEFIELARAVYYTNDLRFKIKDEINSFYGSNIKEQKSYENY